MYMSSVRHIHDPVLSSLKMKGFFLNVEESPPPHITVNGLLWVVSSIRQVVAFRNEKNEIDGERSTCGERRGEYRVLVGKHAGKRRLGRPRHRWKVNMKMDFFFFFWRGMEWFVLAQNRGRWRGLFDARVKLRAT
jgi:hypothetical protein